ncbi:hypothetical protein ILYODFUR_016572 [Ilyodon furcidens]|uniref:Uncharacterized protein n=1 Tax=Ilyodon furcidens TaxID=33524 RepID=A0ABV0SNF3_9TELE
MIDIVITILQHHVLVTGIKRWDFSNYGLHGSMFCGEVSICTPRMAIMSTYHGDETGPTLSVWPCKHHFWLYDPNGRESGEGGQGSEEIRLMTAQKQGITRRTMNK